MMTIFKWLAGLAILGILAIAGLLGLVYFSLIPNLPDVSELRRVEWQMPMSIHSADGKFIAEFGDARRYPVRIEDGRILLDGAALAARSAA